MISIAPSRRIHIATASQETWDLSSPNAPLDLSSTLRTKHEGAAFLADGRGVAARVDHGTLELVVYGDRSREIASRRRVDRVGDKSASRLVDGSIDAAQIAGVVGDVVCMRAERVSTNAGAIDVAREVICARAMTGVIALRALLPRVQQHTPHEECAVGDDPPALVAMTPQEDGLLAQRWPLVMEVSR